MPRRQFALGEISLHQVGPVVRVQGGVPGNRTLERQIAGVVLVHLQGQLALQRHCVEAPRSIERGVDQRLRDTVIDDEVKSNIFECVAQCGAQRGRRPWIATQQWRQIEHRDGFRRIRPYRGNAWCIDIHGYDLLFRARAASFRRCRLEVKGASHSGGCVIGSGDANRCAAAGGQRYRLCLCRRAGGPACIADRRPRRDRCLARGQRRGQDHIGENDCRRAAAAQWLDPVPRNAVGRRTEPRRGAARHHPRARGTPGVSADDGTGKPPARCPCAARSFGNRDVDRARLRDVPPSRRTPPPTGGLDERRRTADAGDRARPDGIAPADHPGRAVPRA